MKIPALFTGLFFIILTAAQADLTIVSEIKSADLQAAPMGNMTMKLANDKVRVDTGPAHIILLAAEKKMLIIVEAQKMIMVKSLNDPQGGSSGEGETPSIERTGKTETISGYECQQVLLKDKKGRVTELWMSSKAPDMSQFASSFKALKNAVPKKSGYEWDSVMTQKDLNTYPIRSIRYSADGKEEMRVTVLSISTASIPASEFTPPAGYTEMTMPDFGGMGGTDISGSAPPHSSTSPNPMQQIQEMQKKIKSGQNPSAEDIKKLQDMANQYQNQSK